MNNPKNIVSGSPFLFPENPDYISYSPLKLTDLTRNKILNYFKNTWSLTDLLFSGLKNREAFYRPPYHNLRHPLIFYYGHPVVCYVNKLRIADIISAPINTYYENIFEIGVDEMSWDDLSKNTMCWPELEELQEYRQSVYKLVTHLIQTHPAFSIKTISPKDPAWALMLALEHERIHLETSSVLIRELPIELVEKPKHWPKLLLDTSLKPQSKELNIQPLQNTWVKIPQQTITLGKTTEIPFYGWDNEYGHKQIEVKEFSTKKFLVTNREFFQFVQDNGYHEPRYWSNKAGEWRSFNNVKHPTFWVTEGPDGLHQYKLRSCFEIIPMQWSWPAIVNYYEASAYCAWLSEKHHKQYRLLTEAEHHSLRDATDPLNANIGLKYGGESPVDAFPENSKGVCDVSGNVWQWMEDHFCPLPGFKAHPYYTDFSSPCFDGAHQIIMGGSFISTGDEATRWARFHFRPHFFQHAGFRLVQAEHMETSCMDCPPPYVGQGPCCIKEKSKNAQTHNDIYETEATLHEYLLLHYGDNNAVVGNKKFRIPTEFLQFPKRCAELVQKSIKKYHISPTRFLDIGCAVGRVCFELSPIFEAVIGIDNSSGFIQTANKLKAGQGIDYFRKEEGEILTTHSIILPEAKNRYQNIIFREADACNLPNELGQFNVILMANVLCRVPNPKQCLLNLISNPGFLSKNALFIIISPYSWLENFTDKHAWLGGIERNGQKIYGKKALIDIMNPELELLEEFEMPLLIREHARKFQLIISEALIWKKS